MLEKLFGILWIVNGIELSEWKYVGKLKEGTTQHYIGIDRVNDNIYIGGGITSSTTSTNKFQRIGLNMNNKSIHINGTSTTTYLAQQLNLVFDLGTFYTEQQNAGFYDNTLYLLLPHYGNDINTIHFISCNIIYEHCQFETALHLNYYDPCITQDGKYLFVSGGTNGHVLNNQIHVCFYIYI